MLPQFLTYFIRSPNGQAAIEDSKGAKTTKQTELGTGKLANIIMPIPRMTVQRGIVAQLDYLHLKINDLKLVQTQTAAELDALLPSILDKAFRAEL
jgi:type I restriction enzyme, S subunit